MFGWFKKREPEVEQRSSTGFTSEMMRLRESYISGHQGIAETTATAQSCVSLWEGGLSLADVEGADLLDRRSMACLGRSLALRGEAVFLIDETGLVPVSDWDLSTRDGLPTAYRLSLPEIGGGRTRTALAAEVLHVRIGVDPAAPWTGVSPLRRAQLTASMLEAVERSLVEVYQYAPLGSQVVPFPEAPDQDMAALGREFSAKRGRVLLRESVAVTSSGGPVPAQDWRPSDLSPDLSKSLSKESLDAARNSICAAYGILPALFNPSTTGPVVRECNRNFCQFTLQPIAQLIAEEATQKLGSEVRLDVMRPLQAWDSGARARSVSAVIGALATAKAAGVDSADVEKVLKLVDWEV